MTWNPKRLRSEIADLLFQLYEHGIVIATRPVVLQSSAGITHVTWDPAPGAGSLIDFGDFATVGEYRRVVADGHYTAMLFDGSLLQLSYVFGGKDLLKHRLCYYPCPVLLSREDLETGEDPLSFFDVDAQDELGLLPFADDPMGPGNVAPDDPAAQPPVRLSSSEGRSRLRLRSPLRFDFDLDAQAEGHPASHLHISHEDCRIPVYGPVSVGHFVRFVFRHFYRGLFDAHGMLRTWPQSFTTRRVTSSECMEMFIDCQRPPEPTPPRRPRARSPRRRART